MRTLIASILFVVACVCTAQGVQAADPAATAQMPAAMKAVNVQPHQVLNAATANEVRGNAFYVAINGVSFSDAFVGTVLVQGYLNYINFYSGSTAMWLQTY
jgi:hypothetical protein